MVGFDPLGGHSMDLEKSTDIMARYTGMIGEFERKRGYDTVPRRYSIDNDCLIIMMIDVPTIEVEEFILCHVRKSFLEALYFLVEITCHVDSFRVSCSLIVE